MRIKRLDITGFKSFMDRSVFSFDDGITGIVGPNGCGKSNVVDAIRWVMGEQSAKNLRGRGMEDVIFNGSETKAPLSMSEVTLTFKLDEGDLLAPEYAGLPEVSVTRRLFRSGESEYLINKTTCRLLDITELFLGTGVGTRAYSIIEQGRVGLIVSAKPEDRRSFIEEAAGVTKYKARRKAAERKMEYTQQNLLRVTDIVTELEKRLDSLERQARKAEKYKKLKAEAREIELHSASHRFLELHAEKKVLQARLESLSVEEREGLTTVRDLEAAITERRAKLELESEELAALAAKVHSLQGQVQLDEQNLTHWTTDTDATRRRIDQANTEVEQLTVRERQLEEQILQKQTEERELLGLGKEDDVALQVAQEELRRVTGLMAQITKRLDQERADLVDIAGRLANHESNLVNLTRRKSELEVRLQQNEGEAEAIRLEAGALEKVRDEVQQSIGQSRLVATELAERRGQEEATLARARQEFAENEIQLICVREELAEKRSRLTSLQEIQRNYEGFDRGVRAIMIKAGAEPASLGVVGLVSDVISTAPEYERAIEAALGERLQHVIVEDRQRGLELARHLKEIAEGRSSFIPLAHEARARTEAVLSSPTPGVLATAVSVVKCDERLLTVAHALLGDVVIVSDLETAQTYSQAEGRGLTLVTVEGEVLRADGTITGGVLEGPAVGALQKKREISELAEEVARVEERYNEIVTRHYSLQKQVGHTEGVLKGLAKNQHAEELNLATREKDLHKAGEDLAKVRDRLHRLEQEHQQLSQGLNEILSEEEASRGEVAHGQTDRESREEKLRQMTSELEGLKGKSDTLSDELTGLRVKTAANSEKLDGAKKEVEALQGQLVEVGQRLTRLSEGLAEGAVHLDELTSRIEETKLAREERLGDLQASSTDLDARRVTHGEASVQVREQESALKERRGRLDSLVGSPGTELEFAL